MFSLDELRSSLDRPDLSDSDLINSISQTLGMEIGRVAEAFGVKRNEPGFVSSFKGAWGAGAEGLGQAMQDVGLPGGQSISNWGEDVQFRNPPSIQSLSDIAESPWQAVKEGAGGAAGYVSQFVGENLLGSALGGVGGFLLGGPPGAAAGAAAGGATQRALRGIGTAAKVAGAALKSTPAQAAVAGLPSYGGIREDQGSNEWWDKLAAAAGAMTVGAIEVGFGIQPRLAKLLAGATTPEAKAVALEAVRQELSKTPLRSAVKEGLKITGAEAGEEFLQSPVEQAASYRNPLEPGNLEETAFSTAMGAIGALPFGALGGAHRYSQHQALGGPPTGSTGLETGEIRPPDTGGTGGGMGVGEQLPLPLGEPQPFAGGQGQQLDSDFQFSKGPDDFQLQPGTSLIEKGIVQSDSEGMIFVVPATDETIEAGDREKVITFDRAKVMPWQQAVQIAQQMGMSNVDLAMAMVTQNYDPTIRQAMGERAKSLGFNAISVQYDDFNAGGGEEIVPFEEGIAGIIPRPMSTGGVMEQQELPLGEGGGQLQLNLQQAQPRPDFQLTPPVGTAVSQPVDLPLTGVVQSMRAWLRAKMDAQTAELTTRGTGPVVHAQGVPTGVLSERTPQYLLSTNYNGPRTRALRKAVIDSVDAYGNSVTPVPAKDAYGQMKPGSIMTVGFFKVREEIATKKAAGLTPSLEDIRAASFERRIYNFVIPLIRSMVEKYAPDMKLVVQLQNSGVGGGFATNLENGVLAISIDPKAALNLRSKSLFSGPFDWLRRSEFANSRAQLLELTTHEFGHALIAYTYEKQTPEVQRALLKEYEKWLGDQSNKTFGEMLLSSGATIREFGEFSSSYSSPAYNALAGGYGPEYWLSFDEYAARRIADLISRRISLKQFSPLTSGYWRALGNKLRHLWNHTMKPWAWENSSLELFLDSLSMANRVTKFEQTFAEALAGPPPSLIDPAKLPEHPANPASKMVVNLSSEEPSSVTAAPSPTKTFESLNRIFGTKLKAGELGKNQARFNWFMKAMLTLPQIERENWTIPGVRPFVDAARNWWGTKGIWTARWDAWVDEVRRSGYGKAELSKLWRFANEVTVLSDELGRRLTLDELAAEARKVGGLDDGLMKLWESGRLVLKDALEELEKLAEVRINEMWNERIAKETSVVRRKEMMDARKAALDENTRDFALMRNRDYWPLARFGTYAVHMKATVPMAFMGKNFKPGDTVLFELFETEGEQAQRKLELLKAHKDKVTVAADRVDESLYSFMGLPPSVLRMLENEIMGAAQDYLTGDEAVDKETLEMAAKQLNAIRTAMLHFTPENAFKQRLLRRKGTRGFTDDGLRAMASLGQSFAGHIARARHRGEMDGALKILDQYRKEIAISEDLAMAGEGNKLSDLLNYLRRSQKDMMNPGNDLANLRAAGFLWYLGAVPRAAIVQVAQPFFTTYPWLATRYGDGAAMAEMAKGYKMIRQLMRNKDQDLKPHLEKAIKAGVAAGILNQSLFTELAGLAEGSNMQRLLPGKFLKSQEAAGMIRKAGYYASYLFQKGEEVNRLVTFRAAYMLELKTLLDMKGATDEQVAQRMQELSGTPEGAEAMQSAYIAGRSATEMTQGEYARWARPELMRGKKSAIFLFKMYSQIMNYFAVRDPGKWRFLAIQLSIAGALGLPFAEDLLDILNAATQGELCKTGDIRDCVREYVSELGMNPELAMHGLARVSTPWDFSASLSLGRVIPTVEPLTSAMMPGGNLKDSALRMQSEALGALFSIPLNWTKAVSSGEERDIEQAMPTVVRDVYRTYRRMREGGERARGGEMIADIDWGDPLDVVTHLGQAAGFRPAEIAEKQEMRWAQKEAAQYWTGRRSAVVGQFYHLYKSGGVPDREALADVMQGVKDFNDSVPFTEMKILPLQLRKGLKQSLARSRLVEEGVAPEKKYRRLYSEVAEGFVPTY